MDLDLFITNGPIMADRKHPALNFRDLKFRWHLGVVETLKLQQDRIVIGIKFVTVPAFHDGYEEYILPDDNNEIRPFEQEIQLKDSKDSKEMQGTPLSWLRPDIQQCQTKSVKRLQSGDRVSGRCSFLKKWSEENCVVWKRSEHTRCWAGSRWNRSSTGSRARL